MSMKNYSNRAKNLVKKHPAASKKFGIQSVEFYYNMFHTKLALEARGD